jgi:formylmethanofuran dehydrogenase subunit E
MTILQTGLINVGCTEQADMNLITLLSLTKERHNRLCPRQVLGVRMGLFAVRLLDLSSPILDKRLLVILETDGCFADGIEVATGCSIGHRTLRVEDYGKAAGTFVDTLTGETIRLVPQADVREKAFLYSRNTQSRYQAQLQGYQVMPDETLFKVQNVQLKKTYQEIIGKAGRRVLCAGCGEEIMNQREIIEGGQVYCRSCLGEGYYISGNSR